MSPVKLFGHPMLTNVARVMLFLEEVGAEYELVPVDYLAGEHKRPQHVKLNVSRQTTIRRSPAVSGDDF
jgi:glutathione S-transferase